VTGSFAESLKLSARKVKDEIVEFDQAGPRESEGNKWYKLVSQKDGKLVSIVLY
jgi:hypothetical protein